MTKLLLILTFSTMLAPSLQAQGLKLMETFTFGSDDFDISVGLSGSSTDPDGIIFSSSHLGPLTLPGPNGSVYTAPGGEVTNAHDDAFVAQWRIGNDHVDWAFQLTGPGYQSALRPTMLTNGDYALLGQPKGETVMSPVLPGVAPEFATTLTPPDYSPDSPFPTADPFTGFLQPDGALRAYDVAVGGLSNFGVVGVPAPDGGVYTVGTTRTGLVFNSGGDNAIALPAPKGELDSFDAYLARYDANAQIVWARRIGGGENPPDLRWEDDAGARVRLLPNGDLAACGYARGTFAGNIYEEDQIDRNVAGTEMDLFVGRWSPDGDIRWLATHGGPGEDRAQSIVSLPNGDLIITGSYSDGALFRFALGFSATYNTRGGGSDQDIFVARLRGSDGQVLWIQTFGSTGLDRGWAMDVSPDGESVFVGGEYGGQLFQNNTRIANFSGTADGFLFRLETGNGGLQGIATLESTGYDSFFEVLAFDNQRLAVLGNHSHQALFRIDGGNQFLPSLGGLDGLLAVIRFEDDPDQWMIR